MIYTISHISASLELFWEFYSIACGITLSAGVLAGVIRLCAQESSVLRKKAGNPKGRIPMFAMPRSEVKQQS